MNNLNLIIGEDKELINFYLKNILNNITYCNDNKIDYDLLENTISDILDEASTISLFTGNKVIIGNDFNPSKLTDNDHEYLNKYLNNINKNVYIILIANKIDARTNIYKLIKKYFNIIDTSNSNNKQNISDYVKEIVTRHQYKMSDYDIEYFLSKVGNDIGSIDNELNKLFTYKDKSKEIDRKDIDLLIIDNIDNVAYEFTNAIIENDHDKVVSMYNNFKIMNVSFDYLISILANNFHQLLVIKILHNAGENNLKIAQKIGKKEFYVKKALERINNYTEKDLTSYISKLADIDYHFKTGQSNFDELALFLITKNEAI